MDNLYAVAESAFDLVYEGSALENHEMDAKDFARAVLSASTLFQDLNRDLHPEDGPIGVNIRAYSAGSFEIFLNLFHHAEGGLTALSTQAAINLETLVVAFASLVRIIRKRSKTEIVSQDEVKPGVVRLTFEDGTTLEVPAGALEASETISIRRELSGVVNPLEADGIEDVVIRRENIEIERVTKDDAQAISMGVGVKAIPELIINERETWLQISSVHFNKNNKWQFSDGGATFWAKILDQAFLSRIENQEEVFRKGDRIHCRIRETQWVDMNERLKTDRDILEVIDHEVGLLQPQLDEPK